MPGKKKNALSKYRETISLHNEEGEHMAVSYNGLWKLLIDKNMKKVDMMNQVGISSSTVAKMTNGELVSMKVLEKICEKLYCDFGDIVHYKKDGGQ